MFVLFIASALMTANVTDGRLITSDRLIQSRSSRPAGLGYPELEGCACCGIPGLAMVTRTRFSSRVKLGWQACLERSHQPKSVHSGLCGLGLLLVGRIPMPGYWDDLYT